MSRAGPAAVDSDHAPSCPGGRGDALGRSCSTRIDARPRSGRSVRAGRVALLALSPEKAVEELLFGARGRDVSLLELANHGEASSEFIV